MILARFFLFLGGQKKQKGEKTGYLPIFAQKSTMDKRKRNILISIVVVLAIAGVIGAPAGIDRMFLHHMGTNATFSYDDLDFNLIATADHFHFGYPPLMRGMYLDSCSEMVRIFKKVKELVDYIVSLKDVV